MREQVKKGGWRPVLLLVLVVSTWASATVISKYLFSHQLATPFTLVVCRFTLAGTFALLLFYLGHRQRQVSALPLVGERRSYLLGGFLITCFIVGYNLALLYITATLGGLYFFALTPVVMLLVGHYWLGTHLGWRQMLGIMVAVLGVVIVISGGDIPHLIASFTGSNLPLGLGLMTLSVLGWGIYGLWGRRYSLPQPGAALLSTGINQLIGVAPVWVLYFMFEPEGLASLDLLAWLLILYMGIVPSALGFALFYNLLKEVSLDQAATIQLFSPVITALLAIVFLNEPFSLALVLGTALLLGGVRIATRTG